MNFAKKIAISKTNPNVLLSPRAFSQKLLARPQLKNEKDMKDIMLKGLHTDLTKV